jgi:hypothetical protein
MADCVRGHWAVENKRHWVLDVSFAEDQAHQRKDHRAENFSRLRRIALNLLRRKTIKSEASKTNASTPPGITTTCSNSWRVENAVTSPRTPYASAHH